jgi:hypothetical protein
MIQDDVDVVSVSKAGEDIEIPNIAIFVPLNNDAKGTKCSFSSALTVFKELAGETLPCGVTLLACTSNLTDSPSGSTSSIGTLGYNSGFRSRQLGDETMSAFSAVFEIQESDQEPLRLEGSSLLVAKAEKYIESPKEVLIGVEKSSKFKYLRISGPTAQHIAIDTIREYSNYIAALFDNFN